jgi:hypothetical protein
MSIWSRAAKNAVCRPQLRPKGMPAGASAPLVQGGIILTAEVGAARTLYDVATHRCHIPNLPRCREQQALSNGRKAPTHLRVRGHVTHPSQRGASFLTTVSWRLSALSLRSDLFAKDASLPRERTTSLSHNLRLSRLSADWSETFFAISSNSNVLFTTSSPDVAHGGRTSIAA